MSTFGRIFRVTTFGESHCKGVGAIVDGVPPCMELTEEDIQPQLTRRRPGQSKLTTPRDEKDHVTIMSGTEFGRTLGTPIGLFVPNENVRPQDYKEMSVIPRPGHADYTYQMKYGNRANSGGGRASARETIGRVAAGAIAEKWLDTVFQTKIVAWVSSIGTVDMPKIELDVKGQESAWTREDVDKIGTLRILRDPSKWRCIPDSEYPDSAELSAAQAKVDGEYELHFNAAVEDVSTAAYEDCNGVVYNRNGLKIEAPHDVEKWRGDDVVPVRCPHPSSAAKMSTLVRELKQAQDSTGGVVTCLITNVPVGLGEPCFDKLEAMLAHAMMSLPATKGFEVGSGFLGTSLRGSQHNDPFIQCEKNSERLDVTKNHAGGILGGISSGADIYFRVAIKPVSTIGQAQSTAAFNGDPSVLEAKGRHDPCVLPRAVPLVEAMASLVLADAALIQRTRCGDEGTFAQSNPISQPVSKKQKL